MVFGGQDVTPRENAFFFFGFPPFSHSAQLLTFLNFYFISRVRTAFSSHHSFQFVMTIISFFPPHRPASTWFIRHRRLSPPWTTHHLKGRKGCVMAPCIHSPTHSSPNPPNHTLPSIPAFPQTWSFLFESASSSGFFKRKKCRSSWLVSYHYVHKCVTGFAASNTKETERRRKKEHCGWQ